ncbi:MAG: hypothetical protein R6W97_02825 [Thiobacillus sp.]
MLQRRLTSWLFALVLIFGQATAFAHVLTHLDLHEPAMPDTVCEVCVAQAQLGSAAPAKPLVLALPAGKFVESPGAATLRAGTSFLAACARAPPASS